MIWGLVLLIAIVIGFGGLLTKRAFASDRQVKLWMLLPIATAIIVIFVGAVGAGWYGFLVYKHDTCISKVDSRAKYIVETHSQFTADARALDATEVLYNTIDAATGTSHYTVDALTSGHVSLRDDLGSRRADLTDQVTKFDAATKPIDPASCSKHP